VVLQAPTGHIQPIAQTHSLWMAGYSQGRILFKF
jgi:hypothetical protein